jgi:uncharacterized protein YciI
MKTLTSRAVVLLGTVLLLSTGLAAQEKPVYDMGKMQMVFLITSPEWKTKDSREARKVEQEQRKHVDALIVSGKCAVAGPTAGAGRIREIMVFKTESTEEVQALTDAFPAVKSGMFKAEILPWFAAKNFIMTPEIPLKPAKYIFGLLVRGPKSTREKTPESEKIQEGHMANINRLAEMGKLVLAGPFYGDGDRRGVFIFKVDSLEEAQALTDTDPAVIAGRLKIELYDWTVPKGTLK